MESIVNLCRRPCGWPAADLSPAAAPGRADPTWEAHLPPVATLVSLWAGGLPQCTPTAPWLEGLRPRLHPAGLD